MPRQVAHLDTSTAPVSASVHLGQEIGPHIGAVHGVVVGQQLQCMRLGDGSIEYRLIDW